MLTLSVKVTHSENWLLVYVSSQTGIKKYWVGWGGGVLINSVDNGIFIIESLSEEDERKERYEGEILKRFLKLMGVRVFYVYVRTKRELKHYIKVYESSNYKYLHLSCHGNKNEIVLTLNEGVSFKELSAFFVSPHKNRRLFLSSCEVMQGNIGRNLAPIQFKSITGPNEEIAFSDAAIFWASFYHILLSVKKNGMKTSDISNTSEKLADLYDISMKVLAFNYEKEIYVEKIKVR